MEKKSKFKFSRYFNFFDIALLIVAAVIVLVLVVSSAINREKSAVTVRYTVEVTGFENGAENLIAVGDPVMDIVKKYDLGTIVDVKHEPTTWDVVDYDQGKVVKAIVPGQVTTLVTVEVEAEDTPNALSVEGKYPLRVGVNVSVRTPALSFSGTLISFEEVDSGEK